MADESFYTTDDVTGSAEFVEGTTTLATRMTFNAAGNIKSIRLFFPDVAPSGTVVGKVYPDSSGSALASANFSPSPTLGAFNLATLSSPHAVSAGTTLRIAIVTPNRYEAEANFFAGGSITRGNITAIDGRFAAGDAFPGSSAVNTTYWADVVFEATADTVTLGQAVDTNTATTLTRSKVRSVAQAVETGTAFAVGRAKSLTLAQAAEANTATALGRSKARAVGQAVETDTAAAPTRSKSRALGQATETDTARAFVGADAPSSGPIVVSTHAVTRVEVRTRTTTVQVEVSAR